jgi:hypothetical protein
VTGEGNDRIPSPHVCFWDLGDTNAVLVVLVLVELMLNDSSVVTYAASLAELSQGDSFGLSLFLTLFTLTALLMSVIQRRSSFLLSKFSTDDQLNFL